MLDLILAALLAQTTPAPQSSATPDAMSEPTSVATGTTPAPTGIPAFRSFPAGPRRIPTELPTLAPGDVLIRNSGSTNTAGYSIVIHPDYTADVADGRGGMVKKTVGAPQAKWLFDRLKADMPFEQLGGGHCMKSASFGSYTTIVYNGERTPDLQCPGGPETRELNRTIGVIVEQLGISTRRVPGMMRL
jgi:hypothetical protein